MKRFVALLLILVCMTSAAAAGPWNLFGITYNGTAKYFGVEEISGDEIQRITTEFENDTYYIDRGTYDLLFQFDDQDMCVNAMARLKDEKDTEIYLLTCLTVITVLGDIDYQAYGSFMDKFANARKGNTPSAGLLNMDAFSISPGEDGVVYQFLYMNKDKAYAP